MMARKKAPDAGSFARPNPRQGDSNLGLLNQARDPNKDDRAYKRNDDGSNYPASRPDADQSKNPSPNDAAQYAEDDVHQNAVATALHYCTGQPTGDQAGDNP